MILVLLLNVLFSLGFIVTKATFAYMSPSLVIGVRMALGGLLLLSTQLFKSTPRHYRSAVHAGGYAIMLFACAAICNVYLTNVLEAWGLAYVPAAKTAIIYSFSPFMAAIIEYIFFNERMTLYKWMGLLLGAAGLALVLIPHYAQEACSYGSIISLPELAIMGAALATVFGWMAVKRLVRRHYPVALINGSTMFIGGVMALLTSFLCEPFHIDMINNALHEPYFWLYTSAGIIIYCLICYNLYAYLLRMYSATFMSFAGFTMPLFTALFGWLFLNETVPLTFFIAFALILGGLCLFYRDEQFA